VFFYTSLIFLYFLVLKRCSGEIFKPEIRRLWRILTVVRNSAHFLLSSSKLLSLFAEAAVSAALEVTVGLTV
jgi:hypothetical protein